MIKEVNNFCAGFSQVHAGASWRRFVYWKIIP